MSPLDRQGNYYAGDKARPDAALASGARTTTGVGTAFDTDQAQSLEGFLAVTAASGTTPTLDVRLETSVDGGTSYDTVGAFTQATAITTDNHVFGPLGDTCRWAWTIGGTTPSFTFSIAVEANE